VANPQLVRCMFDANGAAAGGIASVHWLVNVPPNELLATAEARLAREQVADCAQVFVAGSDGRYVAESFTPAGRRIQFCGHGALTAAWVIFDQHELDAATLTFSNELQSWQARRTAADPGNITLIYRKPSPVDCAVPEFAAAALGEQPLSAAKVGGPAGYLLLELAGEDTVRALQPDYGAIDAATERALIVTAQTMYNDEPACVFRYFAPQYGTPEDAATGSAAVQLAAFWCPRLGCGRFTAMQLSPQGALLQLGCTGDEVDLAARVGYR
jgi:predicted PhzF superfamily epimerase YddE/YHI9